MEIKVHEGDMKGVILYSDRRKRTTQQYADDMVMSKTEDESVRGGGREPERGSNVFE